MSTLRLCSFCLSWNSGPCGEQCQWSPKDPTADEFIKNPGDRRKVGASLMPVTERLLAASQDPMWANTAEVSKKTLEDAVSEIEKPQRGAAKDKGIDL